MSHSAMSATHLGIKHDSLLITSCTLLLPIAKRDEQISRLTREEYLTVTRILNGEHHFSNTSRNKTPSPTT